MNRTPLLLLSTLIGVISLASCSIPGSPRPSATVSQTVTTGSSESLGPSTQTSLTKQHLGIIWSSATDSSRINQTGPAPRFPSNQGVTTRIGLILYLDSSAEGTAAQDCSDTISSEGSRDETHCLLVQWEMDVPADYPEARAYISAEPLVTPAGQQIDQVTGANAAPGTKKVFFGAIYAGGEPGSTVSWQVGSMSNAVSSETFTFEIPAIDAFQPLTFN